MTAPRDMPAYWRAQAAVIARYEAAASPTVAALERCAAELTESFAAADDVLLTLHEAAEASGFTVDHLRHLVRAGTIHDAGRKGAPRVRRGDLPIKPGAPSAATAYDPLVDALAVRRAAGMR